MSNLSPIISITKDQISEVFKRRDVSDQTRKEYERLIGEFIEFMQGRQYHRGILNEYKRHLAGRIKNGDFGTDFAMKKLTTAKVFCQELFGKDKIDVRNFKQNSGHKKEGITPEEMERATAQLKKMKLNPKTIRLLAIVSLMRQQGLREVEISRLKVSDLDFTPIYHEKKLVAGGTMMVWGKGRDDKELVYIAPQCAKILKYYLNYMKEKEYSHTEGYLFFSFSNNKSKGGIAPETISREVSALLRQCEINKTPHRYRHAFTTQTVRRLKGDITKAMMFTRHKDPRTVMIYHKESIHKDDLAVVYGDQQ